MSYGSLVSCPKCKELFIKQDSNLCTNCQTDTKKNTKNEVTNSIFKCIQCKQYNPTLHGGLCPACYALLLKKPISIIPQLDIPEKWYQPSLFESINADLELQTGCEESLRLHTLSPEINDKIMNDLIQINTTLKLSGLDIVTLLKLFIQSRVNLYGILDYKDLLTLCPKEN